MCLLNPVYAILDIFVILHFFFLQNENANTDLHGAALYFADTNLGPGSLPINNVEQCTCPVEYMVSVAYINKLEC